LFSFKDEGLKRVIWLFGPSGSGKTFGAESIHDELYPEEHGKLDVFDTSKDNKWWCNVHPTFKTVIVDNVHHFFI
jgi:adenylate kinase family enzyme